MAEKPILTKEEIKSLIDGIWTGKYSSEKLPYWLFSKLADGFENAASTGWGNVLGDGELKDLQLEESMRNNVYYFAANKTATELETMNALMLASKSKYNFAKEAIKANQLYNYHWYNTEYNVTQRIARAGREWRRIEEFKNDYPLLKFLAVQDGNTRDEHAALHGIIKPVDDPFWKSYFPPLDWNCRCRTQRIEAGAETSLDGYDLPEIEPQFKQRVTDSKKIWHESHPYFDKKPKPVEDAIKGLVKEKTKNQ